MSGIQGSQSPRTKPSSTQRNSSKTGIKIGSKNIGGKAAPKKSSDTRAKKPVQTLAKPNSKESLKDEFVKAENKEAGKTNPLDLQKLPSIEGETVKVRDENQVTPRQVVFDMPEQERQLRWSNTQGNTFAQHVSNLENEAEISGMRSVLTPATENGPAEIQHWAIEDDQNYLYRIRQPLDENDSPVLQDKALEAEKMFMKWNEKDLPRSGSSQIEALAMDHENGVLHAGQIGRYRPDDDFLDVYSASIPALDDGAQPSLDGSNIDMNRTRYKLPEDSPENGLWKGGDFEAMMLGNDSNGNESMFFFAKTDKGRSHLFVGDVPKPGEDSEQELLFMGDVSHLIPEGGKITEAFPAEHGFGYQIDQEDAGGGFERGEHSTWVIPWANGVMGDVVSALENNSPDRIVHPGGRSEAASVALPVGNFLSGLQGRSNIRP